MNNSKYEQIAEYLAGDLKGADLESFERELEENIEFAKEVDLYKEIEKSLSHRMSHQEKEKELRKNLQKIAKEQQLTKSKTRIIQLKNYKKWLVAASVAVLIGVFVFQNQTPEYADYALHSKMDLTVRGNSLETLEKAQEAFNNKDYVLANKYLSTVVKYHKDNSELQLFYGITLIETDYYVLAKEVLKNIADGDSLFKNEALWYLGLNALKQNDLEACKLYLKQISPESEEYKKAKKILKKM